MSRSVLQGAGSGEQYLPVTLRFRLACPPSDCRRRLRRRGRRAALSGQYYVAIAGMVRKPGPYPWREGMTLRELVLLARGPTVGADLREAEVARMPEIAPRAARDHAPGAARLDLPVRARLAGALLRAAGAPLPSRAAPDVPLQSYDNVLILKQPDFDFQRTVVIAGEVSSPAHIRCAPRPIDWRSGESGRRLDVAGVSAGNPVRCERWTTWAASMWIYPAP